MFLTLLLITFLIALPVSFLVSRPFERYPISHFAICVVGSWTFDVFRTVVRDWSCGESAEADWRTVKLTACRAGRERIVRAGAGAT